MKEIENKLIDLRARRDNCRYWIEQCERDLIDEDFSSYEVYNGCKLTLKQNKEEIEQIYEEIDILESALKLLKGEKNE